MRSLAVVSHSRRLLLVVRQSYTGAELCPGHGGLPVFELSSWLAGVRAGGIAHCVVLCVCSVGGPRAASNVSILHS